MSIRLTRDEEARRVGILRIKGEGVGGGEGGGGNGYLGYSKERKRDREMVILGT